MKRRALASTSNWLLTVGATAIISIVWTAVVIRGHHRYVFYHAYSAQTILGLHFGWPVSRLIIISFLLLIVEGCSNSVPRLICHGLGLSLGGGIANALSSLWWHGVPDFLWWHSEYYSPGDLALYLGVALMVVCCVREFASERRAARQDDHPEALEEAGQS